MLIFSDGKKKAACEDIERDLLVCLQRSDCCQQMRKTPNECLRMARDNEDSQAVPIECMLLQRALHRCRLSIMDARSRFRGPSKT